MEVRRLKEGEKELTLDEDEEIDVAQTTLFPIWNPMPTPSHLTSGSPTDVHRSWKVSSFMYPTLETV
jgi:hypothetical protein